jgi:hypothetical protein
LDRRKSRKLIVYEVVSMPANNMSDTNVKVSFSSNLPAD